VLATLRAVALRSILLCPKRSFDALLTSGSHDDVLTLETRFEKAFINLCARMGWRCRVGALADGGPSGITGGLSHLLEAQGRQGDAGRQYPAPCVTA